MPDERTAFQLEIERVIEYTYDFRFRSADSLITRLRQRFPERPMTHLTSANLGWWRLISGDDRPEVRTSFLTDLDRVLTLMRDPGNESLTHEQLFILINTYSFRARLDLMDGHMFRGLLHLGDCLRYLRKSLGQESVFEPLYFTSGLYNFFCDYGMQNYPLLYPSLLVLPRGDMATGRRQLEMASRSAEKWLSTEGHYFLLKIKLDLDEKPLDALDHARWLTTRFPGNLVYQELLYRIMTLSGNTKEAQARLQTLREAAAGNNELSASQKNHFLSLPRDGIRRISN